MALPEVVVYSLSTCSHCKSVKRLLSEAGIEFECTDVDLLKGDERKDAIAKVKEINSRCTFPTLKIGETVVVGFKETEIKEALGL